MKHQHFDYKGFGKAIKTIRVVEIGMGLRPAAKEMGFHFTTLLRLENGLIETGMDMEKIISAANLFGVSMCDYFYTAKTKK